MKRTKASEDDKSNAKKAKPNNIWSNGLLTSMEDPELKVKEDDLIIVIKDKYPKAEFHYLILPKEDISNLKKINSQHLDLLKHMDKIGRELAGNEKHNGKDFKLGYHVQASMFRLHMHVISDDMNSTCMKTKKHWNSFNTDFFILSKDVCKSLEETDKVSLLSADICKKLMEAKLKCHKCNYVPKNMPDLKKHILVHIK